MVDFVLRPAIEKDFPAIRKLIHKTGLNPTSLDWKRFIIAETSSDGRFAGCGQIKPHHDGSQELASIAVEDFARKQGLGRRIIQELLSHAPRPLYLTCREELGIFYRKFGFRALTKDEMPSYFRRISGLADIIVALHLIKSSMLVMKLE